MLLFLVFYLMNHSYSNGSQLYKHYHYRKNFDILYRYSLWLTAVRLTWQRVGIWKPEGRNVWKRRKTAVQKKNSVKLSIYRFVFHRFISRLLISCSCLSAIYAPDYGIFHHSFSSRAPWFLKFNLSFCSNQVLHVNVE